MDVLPDSTKNNVKNLEIKKKEILDLQMKGRKGFFLFDSKEEEVQEKNDNKVKELHTKEVQKKKTPPRRNFGQTNMSPTMMLRSRMKDSVTTKVARALDFSSPEIEEPSKTEKKQPSKNSSHVKSKEANEPSIKKKRVRFAMFSPTKTKKRSLKKQPTLNKAMSFNLGGKMDLSQFIRQRNFQNIEQQQDYQTKPKKNNGVKFSLHSPKHSHSPRHLHSPKHLHSPRRHRYRYKKEMIIEKSNPRKRIHKRSKSNTNTISHKVLLKCVMNKEMEKNLVLVDCRFPYEFQGGTIKGAINVYHPSLLKSFFFINKEKYSNCLIVFFGEYSGRRAPIYYDIMRRLDRKANDKKYPFLDYPQIYLLEAGYRKFFQYSNRKRIQNACTGQYVQMEDERFLIRKNKYSNAFEKCLKTKKKKQSPSKPKGTNDLKKKSGLMRAQSFRFKPF